jgi:chaperone BCS1
MLHSYFDSLDNDSIDDPFLQRAVSSIPKGSLLLIEDIDCAFPSREEAEEAEEHRMPVYNGVGPPPFLMPHQSKVTLSGLLNMIDGVNSEDGKLFFATVRTTFATCASLF